MLKRVDMDSPPAMNRGQPLLLATAMGVKGGEKEFLNGKRIGEVAGRTTAECAAVCCCCPCTMMHLIVLAVYRLPTGLCKKAINKKKKRTLLKKKKKHLLEFNNNITKKSVFDDDDFIGFGSGSDGDEVVGIDIGIVRGDDDLVGVIEAVELDAEMWDRFYGTGFWRSCSQREELENENQKQSLTLR